MEEDENEAEVAEVGPVPRLGPMGDPFVIINLESNEVRVFAEYHHDFVATLVVVSAYRQVFGPDLANVWPSALYRQVVLLGNKTYLHQFLQHIPLSRDKIDACVQLYIDEPCPEQFPSRARRMKELLRSGVPNLETLYTLATRLGPGFEDVSSEAASCIYMA
eukprot:TRINITY_DN37015_c0_g1_i1.p1 TRINITY_DN37015_c0_g1~~TRINITY_DN37015_c0_g1_i1.p1  ORF type:complete len:162 (-),score=36.28 TRINITY_DN37015_c0_g1_i1:112-597(-)